MVINVPVDDLPEETEHVTGWNTRESDEDTIGLTKIPQTPLRRVSSSSPATLLSPSESDGNCTEENMLRKRVYDL